VTKTICETEFPLPSKACKRPAAVISELQLFGAVNFLPVMEAVMQLTMNYQAVYRYLRWGWCTFLWSTPSTFAT
jgi:hypothetical protein